MYEYQAMVTGCIDGDTIEAELDLGFRLKMTMRMRLAGVDTCELHDPDPKRRELAKAARRFVAGFVVAGPVVIRTELDASDKYGRVLAHVSRNGKDLATELLAAGLAVPYTGGTRTGGPVPV